MKGMIKSGYLVGNGAAQNVELGWIPDYVEITNATDSDIITKAYLGGGKQIVPFSSGGTTEIAAGDKIVGATSGAQAWVVEVLLYSGAWADGDAAGFFVVEMIGDTDFGSENVDVGDDSNLATVTANVTHSVNIDTEVGAATSNAAITPYAGSTTASKGFTVGSTVAEEAKLLCYFAFRADQ